MRACAAALHRDGASFEFARKNSHGRKTIVAAAMHIGLLHRNRERRGRPCGAENPGPCQKEPGMVVSIIVAVREFCGRELRPQGDA